jgi:GDP-L-fucose synthase
VSSFWKRKRVVCTGGSGFLGSYLTRRLEAAGASVFIPRRCDGYDLRTEFGVRKMFEDAGQVDVLFHLAATVGGIGANRQRPADFYYDNALMNALVVEFSRRFEVGKLVCVGSVCAYPKSPGYPFREEHLWDGYPEETNAPYGVAKRALVVHLQAARRQYGFNGVYLIPTNLYGPGDSFDPDASHVIPALVRKVVEARRSDAPTVIAWGTGRASRDFLYVDDCAEALVITAERYNGSGPVNLGSGQEITIAGLLGMIMDVAGYRGGVAWDRSQPDGQPRRWLNSDRAWDAFGWRAETPLEEGLRRTIEWYEKEVAPCP